jgi:DNA-directed RNA polymerase specialized sigma24 family protein
MATSEPDPAAPDLAAVAAAILALLVDERESRIANDPDARKTESLLDEAGLTSGQIANLLGKSPGAVRMAISRHRASAAKPKKRNPKD